MLSFYDYLEKKNGKEFGKTIATVTTPCQNLDHTLKDKMKIKHELQDESNSDVYEVKDCNAKHEIGFAICDNFEVLLLDNESEITNKFEEDNKNNRYKVDHCNMNLEI